MMHRPSRSTNSRSTKVGLSECPYHPRYEWLVHFPNGGKRSRAYFRSKKEAEAFQAKREAASANGFLADDESSAVRDYRERLTAVGGSVREAVSVFVEAREADAERKSVTVAEAVEAVIEAKEDEARSQRYLSDLRSRLGQFTAAFGIRPISSLKTEDLDQWMHSLGVAPTTHNNFRRILLVLWTFAEKREWCDGQVAKDCQQVKAIDGEVGILSATETASLLNACGEQIVSAVAIGAFAGVRRAEIERLDWSEVDLQGGHIEIRATKAKSARRRLVGISDNLKAWLAPHAKSDGRVMPPGYQAFIMKARHRAGIHQWPSNALRHGFASYHLALELGHTNATLIFAHYREIVKPPEAAVYWSITPSQ